MKSKVSDEKFWRKVIRKKHIKDFRIYRKSAKEKIFKFIIKREGKWSEEEFDVWVLECGHEVRIDSLNQNRPKKINCWDCEREKHPFKYD